MKAFLGLLDETGRELKWPGYSRQEVWLPETGPWENEYEISWPEYNLYKNTYVISNAAFYTSDIGGDCVMLALSARLHLSRGMTVAFRPGCITLHQYDLDILHGRV